MKYNVVMSILGIAFLTTMLVHAQEGDNATQDRLAELPRMGFIGEVVASDHTTLKFHEFTPPKYPGKKCLFVETGAHRSGFTCWDMPQ